LSASCQETKAASGRIFSVDARSNPVGGAIGMARATEALEQAAASANIAKMVHFMDIQLQKDG
jgi:hypothetical protein